MTSTLLLYPVFAMVVLTLVVSMRMLVMRINAVRNKELNVRYFRLNDGATLPDSLRKTTRHFENLFEFPVLFYVVIVLVFITDSASYTFLVLAWAYVFARIVHAYIHITYNNVNHRMLVFLVSCVLLYSIWGMLFIGLMVG